MKTYVDDNGNQGLYPFFATLPSNYHYDMHDNYYYINHNAVDFIIDTKKILPYLVKWD